MPKAKVAILMGSSSDKAVMQQAWQALEELGVEYEVVVTSAHRSPKRTIKYVENLNKKNIKVIIAGAGGAAHLAGVVSAHTTLPVIGVPVASSPLQGLDSLLSTVQMPPGVPVATMGIGESGARNAGILAVQILAISDATLQKRLIEFRKQQEKKVEKMHEEVQDFILKSKKN